MTQKTVTFEAFCKAYFETHRRAETFRWDDLDQRGKEWWQFQARRMWKELEPKE